MVGFKSREWVLGRNVFKSHWDNLLFYIPARKDARGSDVNQYKTRL